MLSPDFTIEDSEDTVVITVTFVGRSAAKCDLVVADLYAKFNLSPYLLIVDFPELVSPTNVCASAKVNTLVIRIKKEVPQPWPPQPWTFDKETAISRRDASLERLIKAERDREEAARVAAEAAKTAARDRAWDLEKQQRQALRDAEEDEKRYATSLLDGEASAADLCDRPLYEPAHFAPTRTRQAVTMAHTPTMKDVPARYSGPPRTFIVPKKGDASPLWMKQQGDAFFRNGDFRSAINAYEQAVDGSDRQYLAAFSNRAAARLKLGLAKPALNDCNEALQLIAEPILTPEVAKMKVRLLSRKTQALVLEKRYPEAFAACAEILKYERGHEAVKADLQLLIRLSGAKLKESKELAELLQTIEGGAAPKSDGDSA
jgi:tetratricopeptide (TPR) repeat protein